MGRSAVLHRVDQMQYRENSAEITPTTILGVPSQMRVADSRSYLRMTASISSAVPVSPRGKSLLSFSLIVTASFSFVPLLAAMCQKSPPQELAARRLPPKGRRRPMAAYSSPTAGGK